MSRLEPYPVGGTGDEQWSAETGGDARVVDGDASAYRVERECDFDFRLRILPNDDGELAELRLDGCCGGCGGCGGRCRSCHGICGREQLVAVVEAVEVV